MTPRRHELAGVYGRSSNRNPYHESEMDLSRVAGNRTPLQVKMAQLLQVHWKFDGWASRSFDPASCFNTSARHTHPLADLVAHPPEELVTCS